MERFTYFEHGRWRIMIFGVEYAGFPWVDAFAAYENTGLTPEEIAALKNPPNPPLTLGGLRQMDGEPVWCVSINDNFGEYAICHIVECDRNWYISFGGASRAFGDEDTYSKTWLAYRRRPEEVRPYE